MDSRYEKRDQIYVNIKTGVSVYTAEDVGTGEEVVIKEVVTHQPEVANKILRESWIQACLSHPNICKFYGSYYYKDSDRYLCGIVMEKLPGDLWKLIERKAQHRERITEETVWVFLRQLINALALAQEKGICHRDIKPQNLFVDTDRNVIKVGDMGASKVYAQGDELHTIQGTLLYLSPLLKDQYLTNRHQGKAVHNPFKSDVFSLGITCIAIGLGFVPAELGQKDHLSEKLDLAVSRITHFSSVLQSFIRTMVCVEEEGRPDFLELRQQFYEEVEPVVGGLKHDGCLTCFQSEEGERIQLLCQEGHYFCKKDCVVDYVTRETKNHTLPLSQLLCRYCRVPIPEELILPFFNGVYPPLSSAIETCLWCKMHFHSLKISCCEHHFCLNCMKTIRKYEKSPKQCPECDTPFDREQLKKHNALCTVF